MTYLRSLMIYGLASTCPTLTWAQTNNLAKLNIAPIIAPNNAVHFGLYGLSTHSIEAAVGNPAALGYFNANPKEPQLIDQFTFPRLAMVTNSNSLPTAESLVASEQTFPSILADATLSSIEQGDQYAWINFTPSIGFKRTLITPIFDRQLAVTAVDPQRQQIKLLFQERMGFGIGTSFTDESGRFAIGWYSAMLNMKRLSHMQTVTAENSQKTLLAQELSEANTYNYHGSDHNLGILLRLRKRGLSPVLSLDVKHLGTTTYVSNDEEAPNVSYDQEFNLSLNVQPPIGRYLNAEFSAGIHDIANQRSKLKTKWRLGTAIHAKGKQLPYSPVSISLGMSDLGTAYGANINIGLLGLVYANVPENLRANGQRAIERREWLALAIDLMR